MTTVNGTPLRAWLRGCPPSDGAWWRRCACGAPLAAEAGRDVDAMLRRFAVDPAARLLPVGTILESGE